MISAFSQIFNVFCTYKKKRSNKIRRKYINNIRCPKNNSWKGNWITNFRKDDWKSLQSLLIFSLWETSNIARLKTSSSATSWTCNRTCGDSGAFVIRLWSNRKHVGWNNSSLELTVGIHFSNPLSCFQTMSKCQTAEVVVLLSNENGEEDNSAPCDIFCFIPLKQPAVKSHDFLLSNCVCHLC